MSGDPMLVRLYSRALRLYPEDFQQRYAAEMLDDVRREYAVSRDRVRFALQLGGDIVMSVAREHGRRTPARPVALVGFVIFFSLLLLGLALFQQQMWRRGADSVPEALTAQVAAHPGNATALLGLPTEEIASDAWLESRGTFVALYDATGKAVSANATFEGALPQPPRGIFATIRARGLYKVSWQPERGVRVALTGRPLADGGFVLAGQSLLPGESRTFSFYRYLLLMWAVMAVAGGLLWLRAHRRADMQPL